MSLCLIGLGANLGNRQETLSRALNLLGQMRSMRLLQHSRWYETSPAGGPASQPPFLNGAATLETSSEPEKVLALLAGVEKQLGRKRAERWGARTIDLDLLLYDAVVLNTPQLQLPHPRMAWRRFVLEPAEEIAPTMVHPTTGWTIAGLLEHLNTTPQYVALAGPIGAGKTSLAQRLARQNGVECLAEEVNTEHLSSFYADPSGNAWTMELEFLDQRTRLLAADRPEWSKRRGLTVSDFWFDQSLAFASVWLPAERLSAYREAWTAARRQVARPRLTVVLDAPVETMLERIRRRGRPYEATLDAARLEQIRRAILDQLDRPDAGPQLRMSGEDLDAVADEVLAAAASWEPIQNRITPRDRLSADR